MLPNALPLLIREPDNSAALATRSEEGRRNHRSLVLKEIAPSTELRRWFGHDPVRWGEFRRRYRKELGHHPKEIDELHSLARQGPVTLVFAARDKLHNEAVVLQDFLFQR